MIDRILNYEHGNLDLEETLQLFADLVKTGHAWTLQGSYGRTAHDLIESGLITEDGEVNYERLDELADAA